MDKDNAYLLHTRKMVMQDARMTRQSAATITDMRCRWGSPTEVDAWGNDGLEDDFFCYIIRNLNTIFFARVDNPWNVISESFLLPFQT